MDELLNSLNIQIFICSTLVWGCFYFGNRQGASGAAADSVALQVVAMLG